MATEGSKETKLAQIVKKTGDLDKLQLNDQFLELVNQDPPAKFIKDHPLAKGVKYIPIDKIEMMLTNIFQEWYVEVLKTGQLLNSIEVTVRLFYKNPVTKEWQHQDGVGAMAIQVDKGKSASELIHVKSDAIMKGLPAAKSYAIKDAAEHIGKIFGRDLNRKDTIAFSGSYGDSEEAVVVPEISDDIKKAKTNDDLLVIVAKMTAEQKKHYQDELQLKLEELQREGTTTEDGPVV